MTLYGRFVYFMKTASLLVVFMAVGLSLPMSAHANMTNNGPLDHHAQHSDVGSEHAVDAHDTHAAGVDHSSANYDGCETHDAGSNCCSSMCVADVLLVGSSISEADQFHSHIALPYAALSSADRIRLLRPPSL